LNVPAGTASEICTFFSSGISSDFNASVAVNDSGANGNVYITFSRSDTATFPQVRFAGKANGDGCGTFGSGITAFTSPASLTGNFQDGRQRWGDYSAVTIDPSSPSQAMGVNESVNAGGGTWGSRIFRIGIP
jgi:hypothetical protein